jgi:hypothetical protein
MGPREYCSGVALRKMMERLTKPVEELDRQRLAKYCDGLGVDDLSTVEPRTSVRVAGEVRSVRIVPRAGAPALEALVTDGHSSITAVFLGRRKIVGMSPGRRLVLDGFAAADGGRLFVYNPKYRLLPAASPKA